MTEVQWDLGVLVGYPVAGVILLAAVVAVVLLFRSRHYSEWDVLTRRQLAWIGVGVILVVSAVIAIASIPYDPQYHQWRTISGTVEQVDRRLIADGGGGMSERIVIFIDGNPYGVDDTRAATLRVGDDATIACKRSWQWAATPGWVCRWRGES